MPTYEYVCEGCGHTATLFLKLKDIDTPVGCSACEVCTMRRQIGNAGGFRLKGSGWAEDGYATYLGDANKFRSK